MNIVFVTKYDTGNGPMAAAIFQKMHPEHNVSSMALITPKDEKPVAIDKEAVEVMKKYGIDLEGYMSKYITWQDIYDADLLVCVTRANVSDIEEYINIDSNRYCLLEDGVCEVSRGPVSFYEECASELFEKLKAFSKRLKREIPVIRAMTKADVPKVAVVEKECFVNPWSEKSLMEETDNENAHFFVADIGGEIVGYIGTISVWHDCTVTNIAVREMFRGYHIGEKLLDRAIWSADFRDDDVISLEVRKSNSIAINLYEKFGFDLAGERRDFYRNPTENALIYAKDLGAIRREAWSMTFVNRRKGNEDENSCN